MKISSKIKRSLQKRFALQHIAFCSFSFFNFRSILQRTVFIVFSLLSINHVLAQDLRFTQIHASDTWVNPAFIGIKGQPRLEINFRDQWPSIPQTYVSYRLALDLTLPNLNSGVGAFATKDDEGQGVLATTQVGLQYSYQLRLNSGMTLQIGMQGSYAQKKLNWESLQFYDQINPIFGFNDGAGNQNPTNQTLPNSFNVKYWDFMTGLLLFTENWYIGISASHFTSPDVSFYQEIESAIPLSIGIQAGYELRYGSKKDGVTISPLLTFMMQDQFTQIQLGSYFRKSSLIAGLFVKSNFKELSDFSVLAGMRKGLATFTYSYDLSLGSLSGESGGAHEIGIVLLFRQWEGNENDIKRNKRALDCPSVF